MSKWHIFINHMSRLIFSGCYNKTESDKYEGPVFSTLKGEVCDNWLNHQNGEYNYNDNLCRNPEPEHFERPWCFNQHGKRRVCDVPECGRLIN